MDEKHLINKFLEFEETNKLFDIKVRGFQVWAFVRFSVYFQLIEEEFKTGKPHNKQTRTSKFCNYIANSFTAFFLHNPIFFLKKKECIFFNHSRRFFFNNKWEEPYTDQFLLKMDKRDFYIFEAPSLEKHSKNVLVPHNRKYLDTINLICTVYARIFSKSNHFKKHEYEKLKTIEKLIFSTFNFQISISEIEYNFFYLKIYKKILRYIVKKIQPKVIYQVVYYNPINMLVNQIATELGIPTVEFQHGTMGHYHIAYNIKSTEQQDWLPKKIWFFNEFWKDSIRLPIKEEDKIIYGNPYLENVKQSYARKSVKDHSIKMILFISQGTIGDKLAALALDISKKLNNKIFKLIFKLHPSEYPDWRRRYPELSNSNIEVVDNNQTHLYEYFAKSDIQIGVYSTAIYEGLEFGLKTFILKAYGWQYMEELIRNHSVSLIEKSDDVLQTIISNKND